MRSRERVTSISFVCRILIVLFSTTILIRVVEIAFIDRVVLKRRFARFKDTYFISRRCMLLDL